VLDGEEIEKLLRGEKLEPISRSRGDGQAQLPAAAQEIEPAPPAKAPAPRIAPTESPGLA